MSVSGSGKTTVARRLAHALDWPWRSRTSATTEPGRRRSLTLVQDQRERSQTNAGRLWVAQAKEMRWDSNVESMLGSSISIMKSPS